MKDAIGGTWLFQIVIVFILLFTGFMCLSINRSKAFNVKDKIIQTIQTYNGIDLSGAGSSAMDEIVDYIKDNSYRTTGVKPPDETVNGSKVSYDCFKRDVTPTESKPVFCIAHMNVKNEVGVEESFELPDMSYYRVVVFYQLDLPVFHDLFNFRVVGDTKLLYR